MFGWRRSSAPVDINEMIDRIQWHILRFDQLRSSVANRAAIVLSANALVIAGSAAFSSRALESPTTRPIALKTATAVGILGVLLLSAASISYAIQALVNIRPWRKVHRENVPISMYYHHADTIRNSSSYGEYSNRFKLATREELLEYALTDLWVITRTLNLRNRKFRKAVQFLLASLMALVVTASFSIWIQLSA
jgi:hypothetical protein